MPFLEDSQIAALGFKDKITLKSIFDDIQNNTELEYSNNAPKSGSRPLPVGTNSPFMIIGEKPSRLDLEYYFDNPEASKDIDNMCHVLGLSKSDFYLTYLIKYLAPENEERIPNFVGKNHGKEFIHREIFAVNPEIIFLIGSYTKTVFQKIYLNASLDSIIQRVTLDLHIDRTELHYSVNVICLDSLSNIKQIEEIKPVINRVKLNWKFVHLHCHNSLSLKDGVGSPASRIAWHVEHKKPAIATSNHGSISDWYKIYEGARANGMMPILGVEAYFNREADELQKIIDLDSTEARSLKKKYRALNRHVTLFAKNETGFFNLIKVQNDAWVNRFYRVPIISPSYLKDHHEGIICLSGCANGEQNKIISDKYFLTSDEHKKEIDNLIGNKLKSMSTLINTKNDTRASDDEYLDDNDLNYFYSHISDKKLNKAEYEAYARDFIAKSDQEKINTADKRVREIVDWWHNIFGDDYYLELMVIDYAPQRFINEELIKISKEKNIPVVITNDCHYLTKAESSIQELQMLSDQEKTFADLEEDRASGKNKIWTIKSKEFYYKSVDELYDSWKQWCASDIFTEEEFWKAIENTITIPNKVSTWELDRSVKLPRLYDNGKEILIRKCAEGMRHYGLIGKKEYEDQLKYELSVIIKKGYVDYFLIVEDIVSWVKKTYGRLGVGCGRGSAAGGLVNYLIGLTYIDPLKYNLLFERFLDPSREDLPDIDQDIQPRYRDALIDHMVETYGAKSVCNIGTYGILKTRSAIQDACRVCGIESQEVFALTTKLPKDLDETKKLSELEEEYPELKTFLDKYDTPKMPLRFFISHIKGMQKSIGTHAAGVLISKNVLFDNIPLIRSKKTIVTGWIDGEDGRELSGLNYAKMDVLGLKNLEVIADAVALIKERHGIDVDVDAIDLDDKKIYDNVVNTGDNFGIFQFEGGLGAQLIEKIHPDNMMELSDISAMMRPGPLKMGIPDMYADRKFGRHKDGEKAWSVDDIPQCIRPVLKDTYGTIIFQEQVMKIAELIGGQTRAETNKFRKLLIKYGKFSKGNPDYEKNIGKYHDKFIKTASKPEYLGSEKAAEDLFTLMANFAAYGFNKSHSVSYSKVSAIEYWLKTYYPAEFNVALINNTDVKKEKKGESVMSQYITSIYRHGTKIMRPSVNFSDRNFSLTDDEKILWGLSAIKGVSDATIERIMAARKIRIFSTMEDMLERVGKKWLNKRAAEALIWSGAFDDFKTEEMNTRFDIHKYFFTVVRGDKKYEDPDDKHEINFLIKKEIDLCKFSLYEMRMFNRRRKTLYQETDKTPDYLYEIDEVGDYNVVAKIEKKEKKKTKKGADYYSFILRDDTAIVRNLSYFYPWQAKQGTDMYDELTIKLEELEEGKVYLFQLQHNDKGFKNIKAFTPL